MQNLINRNHFLKAVGLFSAGFLSRGLLPKMDNPIQNLILPDINAGNWGAFAFMEDPVMNDQLRLTITHMLFQGSDLGECMATAGRIDPGKPFSWYKEWQKTADTIREQAEDYAGKGKDTSAAGAFRRAASYYRTSLLRHPDQKNDKTVPAVALKAKDCFDLAMQHAGYPGTYLEIPYQNSKLPAYFFKSPVAKKKAPVIIFHQGRDAWPEDTAWIYDGAIKRGIHCLGVHCPGQGLAIRVNNLPFRYDWENVVTPIINIAQELPGVDKKRMALMGLSMGGALVPRALAFEKRIKLGIVNPGVLSWGESMGEAFSSVPGVMSLYKSSPGTFNQAIETLCASWSTADWWYKDSSWKHGVDTPYDLFSELFKFDNKPIIRKIKTPILIMDGAGEEFSKGQAEKLADSLASKNETMFFDVASSAHLHCQNGGLAYASERFFNWFEDHI